jgi:hypothetical protein
MTLGDVIVWGVLAVVAVAVVLAVLGAIVLIIGARALARGDDIA